jgi:hypothetical protein
MAAEVARRSPLGRLYDERVIGPCRAIFGDALRGIERGELPASTDIELAIDQLVGMLLLRRLTGRLQRAESDLAERAVDSTHVLPRWIGGKPYDACDIAPFNMIRWRLMNLVYRLRVAQELGPAPASWPVGTHRLLEGIPIVSSDCSRRCAGETSWSSRRSIGSYRIGCTSSTSRKRCWTASSTAPATASAFPSCRRHWCQRTVGTVGGTHTGRLGRASSGTRVIEAIKLYNPEAIQPNRSWNSEREL